MPHREPLWQRSNHRLIFSHLTACISSVDDVDSLFDNWLFADALSIGMKTISIQRHSSSPTAELLSIIGPFHLEIVRSIDGQVPIVLLIDSR